MGDWDWDGLAVVGRDLAGIWLWTFLIMIVMLMLNMLLAIVMDAYSELKASVGNAQTLVAETMQAYSRWRGGRKGTHISLLNVFRAVRSFKEYKVLHRKQSVMYGSDGKPLPQAHETEEDRLSVVTVQTLQKAIPKLSTAQALVLLEGA